MILDLQLKGNELIVFAIINGYSQDGESCFSGHLARLQEWTSLSKQSIITILSSLQEKGLITKFPVTINGVNRTGYRAVKVVKKLDQPKKSKVKKLDQEGQKTLPPKVKKVDPIKDSVNDGKKTDDSVTDISEEEFLTAILGLGVSEQTAYDWMKVRKAKRAKCTVSAVDFVTKEIEKAKKYGHTAEECIALSAANSWQGFQAKYIVPELNKKDKTNHKDQVSSIPYSKSITID